MVDDATAVERFSARHDELVAVPRGGRWADLIPLSAPAPGEQYGFEVDLDACSGCKACVSACHHLNGLADGEAWRRTGLMIGTTTPWRQTITTACHHCVEPACLAGCPVDAYEKDPITGIVAHLDDQCIGCSYCTLTCPYEVPRFDADRGIVRKCDLCQDRLADGEAPACVQACPTEAISVRVVSTAEVRAVAAGGAVLVPGAPPSSLTLPTTRYRSCRPVPADAVAADHREVDPGHDHWPLAVMLVLTQLSVGALAVDWVRWLTDPGAGPLGAGVALALGVLALVASLAHLGRPWLAWRAVIGLRHSWLSREIVAFGAYAGLATVWAASRAVGPDGATGGGIGPAGATAAAGGAAVAAGVAAVGCSVAVYAVTGRRWWALGPTALRFGATTVVCGGAVAGAIAVLATGTSPGVVAAAVAAGTGLTLGADVAVLRHRHRTGELARTAALLTTRLATPAAWRLGLAVAGAVVTVVGLLATAAAVAALGALTLLAAELLGRRLWFLAVAPDRFPGELR